MDRKESVLFCGVIGLQADVGGAVIVALKIVVDGAFNDGFDHGAILHVDICLDTPGKKRAGGC